MAFPMSDNPQPWGRLATFGLGLVALFGGQAAALAALQGWFGRSLTQMPDFSGDGVAVSIVIFVSIPVQTALLWLMAQRPGGSAAAYLGLVWPRRGEVLFGVAATLALIVAGDTLSFAVGRFIVTPFQLDIYRTAAAAGWLPLLWLAVVVVTPIGEESLFRGFLFRGWLRAPGDAWPVIVVTAFLWAIVHVQYDLYVIAQVFCFGVLLGWLRWASGSAILTMLLHGLINCEGMLETAISLHR
ncbi:MAG TPA: CPBP family intramembrane glutamic endopeptidase [Pseudolabrys sp.]|nr:CPBP family intramembrane glutamic endopeptidase [Pseudolabrys sp.]